MRRTASIPRTPSMLDLWRPPADAGEPIGCLATTYTFTPELFEEQCLAGFLGVDAEPSKEGLAFRLEREERLGTTYAGVLVDRAHAGVAHSLNWDVLPVAVPGGKQHAKLSLLVWSHSVRLIVASANLTVPGYRINREVALASDFRPGSCDGSLLKSARDFLSQLLDLVPGVAGSQPEVERASAFLAQVDRMTQRWKRSVRQGISHHLATTMPTTGSQPKKSALESMMSASHAGKDAPNQVEIASPFFGSDADATAVVRALVSRMAPSREPIVSFCVPEVAASSKGRYLRLAAPKALISAACQAAAIPAAFVLPLMEGNVARPWHAKMVKLNGHGFHALMVGSSNFTGAGMGVGIKRNAEANLLTLVKVGHNKRAMERIDAVWPTLQKIDLDRAEWLAAAQPPDEDESTAPILPGGFLPALFRVGEPGTIVLRLDPDQLPAEWRILATDPDPQDLLSSDAWHSRGRPAVVEVAWMAPRPPGVNNRPYSPPATGQIPHPGGDAVLVV